MGATNTPKNDDYVLIVEVDRTSTSTNAQDNDAEISITATDDDGASNTGKIKVTVTDENLPPATGLTAKNGVTLSDATPHQKDTLTFTFSPNVDPDFTGAKKGTPILVINQVIKDVNGDTIDRSTQIGTTAKYKVTQDDVGAEIQGKFFYYEQFGNNIVRSDTGNTSLQKNSGMVGDRQDPASGTFTWLTNTDDELVANCSDHGPGRRG